ncbi:MAG: S24/S26 family peptidase, partial [Bacteroidales bacterium]|nr:S24/S26 family peptidase [Bacteroidales bacterium]
MLKRVENTVFFEEVAHSLSEGRPVELRVQGNSMRPCLRGGKDRVVLYPTKDAELKKGCIVLFRYRGNYLLHRIVKRNKDSLTLQGDGVFAQQEQAVVADVVGVVR